MQRPLLQEQCSPCILGRGCLSSPRVSGAASNAVEVCGMTAETRSVTPKPGLGPCLPLGCNSHTLPRQWGSLLSRHPCALTVSPGKRQGDEAASLQPPTCCLLPARTLASSPDCQLSSPLSGPLARGLAPVFFRPPHFTSIPLCSSGLRGSPPTSPPKPAATLRLLPTRS